MRQGAARQFIAGEAAGPCLDRAAGHGIHAGRPRAGGRGRAGAGAAGGQGQRGSGGRGIAGALCRRAGGSRWPARHAWQYQHHEGAVQHHQLYVGDDPEPAIGDGGRCGEQGSVRALHRHAGRQHRQHVHPRLSDRRGQQRGDRLRRPVWRRAELPCVHRLRGARGGHQGAGGAVVWDVAERRRWRRGQYRAKARHGRSDVVYRQLCVRHPVGRPPRCGAPVRAGPGIRHSRQRQLLPGRHGAGQSIAQGRHRLRGARLPGHAPARRWT